MKKIFCLVIQLYCVLYFLSGCEFSTEPTHKIIEVEELPAVEINWDQSKSIVCFGTSLTYGLEAESLKPDSLPKTFENTIVPFHQADSSYPVVLDKKLKINVYNQGHTGYTVDRARTILRDDVFSKRPALVLLEFSANDFLREKDVSEVEPDMRALIDSILFFGSKIILISFVDEITVKNPPKEHVLYENKELARNYFDMLQRLSKDYNLLLIRDCFTSVFGQEKYMSDDVHPNNNGYIKMANNIFKSLYLTFKLNNMLN